MATEEKEAAAGKRAAGEAQAPRRRRRWPWIVLVALVSLVVGLRVALPTIVERGAAYGSRYWLGLPVRIDNVDFELVDGRVVLEGVTVGAEPDQVSPRDALLSPPPIDPASALFHLDRMAAHLSWTDLKKGSVHLDELDLEAPSVRVVREADGAIDPLRHARPLAPPSPAEPPAPEHAAAEKAAPPAEPWPILVDTFALSAPNVVVVDPKSSENLLQFSLEKFALDKISVHGSNFALGGLQIEGPVLRVRRDLVLAAPAAKASAAPAPHPVPPPPPIGAPESAASAGTASSAPVPAEPSPAPPPAPAAPVAPPEPPAAATPTSPAPESPASPSPASPATPATPEAPVPVATPAAPEAPAPGAAPATPEAPATAPSPASPGEGAASPSPAPAPAPDGKAKSGTASPPASSRPGYRIEKIDIDRATFTWVTDHGPLDVALGLKASSITADEGKQFPVDLQLEIAKGRIALAGEVGILPPSYKGKLTWSGLPFPPLLLASLPDFAEWLQSADSTGDLVIDADVGGLRGPPTLHMSGRAAIETLAVSDPSRKEVAIGWKQLEVVMNDVLVPLPEQGKPARTTVANLELVKLVEPKIHYTHPSPSLYRWIGEPAAPAANDGGDAKGGGDAKATAAASAKAGKDAGKVASKDAAAKAKAADKTKDAKPAAEPAPVAAKNAQPVPLEVTVKLLQLVAGDLDVNDTTVTPPVVSTVKDLEVSAANVHIPDPSSSAIHVAASLPTASTLRVDGDLRPGNNGDFTLVLDKLDLPFFSPYAAAAGASLDAGQASLTTKLKIRGTNMQVDNDLVLRKFGVSLHDPGSFDRNFGMPIDLALALLRDPYGNIRLKIPVTIGEKGAEVSMGAVIASALKAALLGAVTAPLKLLGAAFGGLGEGGGGFSIAPIDCSAGAAELAGDAGARADGLARLLAQRPSMGLLLKGRTGEADAPVVAEQILVEGLKAGKGLPDLEGSGFLARRRIGQALLARDKAASGKGGKAPELSGDDQALFDRYIKAVAIPAERLDALARSRAEKARDLLVSKKVDAGKLEVGPREADGSPAVVFSLKAAPAPVAAPAKVKKP